MDSSYLPPNQRLVTQIWYEGRWVTIDTVDTKYVTQDEFKRRLHNLTNKRMDDLYRVYLEQKTLVLSPTLGVHLWFESSENQSAVMQSTTIITDRVNDHNKPVS